MAADWRQPSSRSWRQRARGIGLAASFLAPLVMGGYAQAASLTTAALWHMDETSGTTMVDSTPNHNDGSLANVTVGVNGIKGSSAYGFDGSDSLVSVPNSTSLNPGSASFTLSAHLNLAIPPSTGKDYDIIRKGV